MPDGGCDAGDMDFLNSSLPKRPSSFVSSFLLLVVLLVWALGIRLLRGPLFDEKNDAMVLARS